MNHRRIAIIFLFIILLIMPYYCGLKEAIENQNYTVADKYKYSELLTDYITLLKDSNQALVNTDKNITVRDDYKAQFDYMFAL